ncbi:hypothetical protein ACFV16_38300 [Streptomyces massasporeus]|uniref:hypothetical protein n=1 Tax=Streptomyces massasporeus TaxID=67324 RepID=UPI0036B9423D
MTTSYPQCGAVCTVGVDCPVFAGLLLSRLPQRAWQLLAATERTHAQVHTGLAHLHQAAAAKRCSRR